MKGEMSDESVRKRVKRAPEAGTVEEARGFAVKKKKRCSVRSRIACN